MMNFTVNNEVFDVIDDFCVGVVVAYQVDNMQPKQEIYNMLIEEMEKTYDAISDLNLKDHPLIFPYRVAMDAFGINPNKFPCSIEAMLKRIQKGGAIPSINPIVDLNNLISVRYFLPMGSHDIDALTGECSIRLSSEGDIFLPLGDTTEEVLPAGELVYADAQRIRTRRWIWRQSEIGKITQESKTIFFPIDGFLSVNETSVRAAQEDLAELLQQFFDCKIHLDFIDKSHPSTTILP